MNKLDEIVASKQAEVARLLPIADKLRAAAGGRDDFRSLADSLRADPSRLSIIAEVKRASPSAGTIAESFDPLTIARGYERAGASGISVLTDQDYFKGHLNHLSLVRPEVGIPCLRKDFIIHETQIHEAVVAGADAILLIVAALKQDQLLHLLEVAHTFQLEVLMEVHDLRELERALETDVRILGINNRNLQKFTVDLGTTEALAEEVPDDVILVAESGIKTPADAQRLADCGADALLIGETLMRSPDIMRDLPAMRAFKPEAAATPEDE
jgi:indole-3-glycerol phosphate synthase